MTAKVGAATLLTAGLYWLARATVFRMGWLNDRFDVVQFTFDGVLLGFWILPMVWIGLVVAAWHDQTFRCRTCARRLRMPLTDGSYGTLLLEHPGTEWVCPFGHGKLRVEVWVADQTPPNWQKYGEFWEELFRR